LKDPTAVRAADAITMEWLVTDVSSSFCFVETVAKLPCEVKQL